MKEYIEAMEAYALQNHIPIMQKEGILFMQDLIQKHKVKKILEIGTAIGYSAIQMCQVMNDVEVVTIERDEERYQQAIKNVSLCGLEKRITLILADALTAVIEGNYDLIFIDAAKAQYIKFFERYKENLKDTGIIVSDNLKFHGLVDSTEPIPNRNTRQLVKKIRMYHAYLETHPEYKTVFYDIGDGIAVSEKMMKNE